MKVVTAFPPFVGELRGLAPDAEVVGVQSPLEAGNQVRDADVYIGLTADTRGMFDQAFFEGMKPTAFFVNVGRGPSVVTEDLVEALRSGTIAGAGLDVTDPSRCRPATRSGICRT